MSFTAAPADTRPELRIGMIGYSFMGAAHSQGWQVAPKFFDLALNPVMKTIVGRNADAVAEAATKLGWQTYNTDWRAVVESDEIDLIDICTPGDTHAEIAIAALNAGKHVLCEKPLANSVQEAEAMAAAAERAATKGVRAMVGFTYRRVPAVALARELIAAGKIGSIRQVRAQYLQDWLADESAPLSWRLDKEKAGSGALGDIGAHIIDLTQYMTGESITGVTGMMETFVDERPVSISHSGLSGEAGSERGPVTVDDAALFLARFSGGAIATFEATRFACRRNTDIRIEINGTKGSVAFDFEDMNVLEFFDASDEQQTAGYRRIIATEEGHPYIAAWWPPRHGLGYEHGFVHPTADLIQDIANDRQPLPSFADGLAVQRVLAAVESSADAGTVWTPIS